jgi:hypothetical protein
MKGGVYASRAQFRLQPVSEWRWRKPKVGAQRAGGEEVKRGGVYASTYLMVYCGQQDRLRSGL